MPKTLADGKLKVTALTTAPADPAAVTATEANAGIDIQGRVLKSDFRLSPTGSDTVNEAELDATGNAVVYGASNFEGTVSPFRYLDETGKPVVADEDAWELLKEKGSHLFLMLREGPAPTADWAAADEYELYEVITDSPQHPSDRSGYIKRIVPLGVQDAWLNKAVAAGV